MALKIKKPILIKALVALGFVDAANMPDAKLLKKAQTLPKLVNDDNIGKLPEKGQVQVKDWVEKIKAGETVQIEGAAETAAPAKAAPAGKTAAAPAAKEKKAKAPKEPKGPGVIMSIVEFLQGASKTKPIKKDEIHAKLVARFPLRDADSMRTTVGLQVPSKLKADKGLTVEKNENGFWLPKTAVVATK